MIKVKKLKVSSTFQESKGYVFFLGGGRVDFRFYKCAMLKINGKFLRIIAKGMELDKQILENRTGCKQRSQSVPK